MLNAQVVRNKPFPLKFYSWRYRFKRVLPLKALRYSDHREILVLVLCVCIICRWFQICIGRKSRKSDRAACVWLHGGMSPFLSLICCLDTLRVVLQPCTDSFQDWTWQDGGKEIKKRQTCRQAWPGWTELSDGESAVSEQLLVCFIELKREVGHYVQINKETGMADLGRSSLCRKGFFWP